VTRRLATAVVGAALALLPASAAAAAADVADGPQPGTTTPTERLDVLGETIDRSGEASADDLLTWTLAVGTVGAAGAAAVAGARLVRRRPVHRSV
jgi:hypothetical protein